MQLIKIDVSFYIGKNMNQILRKNMYRYNEKIF